jgi:hypothetical protein
MEVWRNIKPMLVATRHALVVLRSCHLWGVSNLANRLSERATVESLKKQTCNGCSISHKIHGAIYGNMDPINIPQMSIHGKCYHTYIYIWWSYGIIYHLYIYQHHGSVMGHRHEKPVILTDGNHPDRTCCRSRPRLWTIPIPIIGLSRSRDKNRGLSFTYSNHQQRHFRQFYKCYTLYIYIISYIYNIKYNIYIYVYIKSNSQVLIVHPQFCCIHLIPIVVSW